jgi:tRNA 2-(methylsulfanyl)-N6-isopentenyladenosine37 hydroxylase
MLLFREKVPADWLPKILADLPAVLVDHAHLERKAATTALNLEKYRDLFPRVEELNAIAIEELQHFQMVLTLLKRRNIPLVNLTRARGSADSCARFGMEHAARWLTI